MASYSAELALIDVMQAGLRTFTQEMKALGYTQAQIMQGIGSAMFCNLELPKYSEFDEALTKDLAYNQCMTVLRMLQNRARAEGFTDDILHDAFLVEDGAKHARWQIMIEAQKKRTQVELQETL